MGQRLLRGALPSASIAGVWRMVVWKMSGVSGMLGRAEHRRHATMGDWRILRPVSIGRRVCVLTGATHMTESYQLIRRMVLVRGGMTKL
jgi:hypothetical protein